MNEAGTILAEERIDHAFPERFAELIGKHTPAQVAFEATMNWGWLHEILEAIAGIERIVMANPLHVRLIAAAQVKTDKVDARKLANSPFSEPSPHIPDRATRMRKEVLRQRTFWVRERTKVRNRIHRLLGRQHGLAMPQVSDLFGKKGKAALNKLVLAAPDDLLLRQQLEMLDCLERHIRELDEKIALEGKGDEAVGRLSSIPGIGPILGNVIATEIDGIERFGLSEQLSAYAGLIPTTSSSGDKTYHGRLVSGCNKWLRWALVEAAWVAVGCDAYWRPLSPSSPLAREEGQHSDHDHRAADVSDHLLRASREASLSGAPVESECPRLLSSKTDGARRISGDAGVLGQSREPGI
ncbi:MAG: IS110 family transposase [Kiritimatiellae bacterium]|nr:IS110 family transposase [Kiritimatiellia bacterium]